MSYQFDPATSFDPSVLSDELSQNFSVAQKFEDRQNWGSGASAQYEMFEQPTIFNDNPHLGQDDGWGQPQDMQASPTYDSVVQQARAASACMEMRPPPMPARSHHATSAYREMRPPPLPAHSQHAYSADVETRPHGPPTPLSHVTLAHDGMPPPPTPVERHHAPPADLKMRSSYHQPPVPHYRTSSGDGEMHRAYVPPTPAQRFRPASACGSNSHVQPSLQQSYAASAYTEMGTPGERSSLLDRPHTAASYSEGSPHGFAPSPYHSHAATAWRDTGTPIGPHTFGLGGHAPETWPSGYDFAFAHKADPTRDNHYQDHITASPPHHGFGQSSFEPYATGFVQPHPSGDDDHPRYGLDFRDPPSSSVRSYQNRQARRNASTMRPLDRGSSFYAPGMSRPQAVAELPSCGVVLRSQSDDDLHSAELPLCGVILPSQADDDLHPASIARDDDSAADITTDAKSSRKRARSMNPSPSSSPREGWVQPLRRHRKKQKRSQKIRSQPQRPQTSSRLRYPRGVSPPRHYQNPENPWNVCPPLGMAQTLGQANEWAEKYEFSMNGLVPVPNVVQDKDGNELPATNNGRRNPYTKTFTSYRVDWEGDGAHPSTAQAPKPRKKKGDITPLNKIPLPSGRWEVLRVLGIGPYYGYCTPVVDFDDLKEYHRLFPGVQMHNWLTNLIKDTLTAYYSTDLCLYSQPYYYCLFNDVLSKPQVPQGYRTVELKNEAKTKIILKSFNIRDKTFYENWKAKKDGLTGKRLKVTDGPSFGAVAASTVVKEMKDDGWPVRAYVHITNFSLVKHQLEFDELHWCDWTGGDSVDDHWLWHVGNQAERRVWQPRTRRFCPRLGEDTEDAEEDEAHVDPKTGHPKQVYRYDKDLHASSFTKRGNLITDKGILKVIHKGKKV